MATQTHGKQLPELLILEPFVATSVVRLDCFPVVTNPAKMVVPSQGLEPVAVPSLGLIVGVHDVGLPSNLSCLAFKPELQMSE